MFTPFPLWWQAPKSCSLDSWVTTTRLPPPSCSSGRQMFGWKQIKSTEQMWTRPFLTSLHSPPATAWVPWKQLSEHGRELEDHTAQPPHPCQVAATRSSGWKAHTTCPGYLPQPFSPARFPGITSHTNDPCCRGQCTPVYTMFWARAAKIRKACPLKTVNLTGKPTFFPLIKNLRENVTDLQEG